MTEPTTTTRSRRKRPDPEPEAGAVLRTQLEHEQTPPEVRAAVDAGRSVVLDEPAATEVGYFGYPVDPRPNEHYTLKGEAARRAEAG